MKTLNSIAALAIAAGTLGFDHAASAMPGFDPSPRGGIAGIEKARIVCEPFGRCFRIDPYGRRIFVPRPFGFGRPGFDGPEVGRPGFGRPGFDGPEVGRPGFGGPDRGGPAFGDGDRGPQGGPGKRHAPRPDQTDRKGDQDGQGQAHRPDGASQRGAQEGQGGQNGQQRHRRQQQDDAQ